MHWNKRHSYLTTTQGDVLTAKLLQTRTKKKSVEDNKGRWVINKAAFEKYSKKSPLHAKLISQKP